MTYEEIKKRLTEVETALQTIGSGKKTTLETSYTGKSISNLSTLKESLQKQLAEKEETMFISTKGGDTKAVSMDRKTAMDLKKDPNITGIETAKGQDLKELDRLDKNTGIEFDQNETAMLATETGKALAKALINSGDELARMRVKRIQPMSFDVHVVYKGERNMDDEFSFHIQDNNLHLVDFSFDKKLVEVGIAGSGKPIVNKDVLTNELMKHFKSLNEEVNEINYSIYTEPKHFDICPGAESLRDELINGGKSPEELGEWTFKHDELFRLEKAVLKSNKADERHVKVANQLRDEIINLSRDLEIEPGKINYLKGHVQKIEDVANKTDGKGDSVTLMGQDVEETKGAPKGHYFTKSGNLVKGRLTKDAKERGARLSDPKDKQRSKVPPVTQYNEEVSSRFINKYYTRATPSDYLGSDEFKDNDDYLKYYEIENLESYSNRDKAILLFLDVEHGISLSDKLAKDIKGKSPEDLVKYFKDRDYGYMDYSVMKRQLGIKTPVVTSMTWDETGGPLGADSAFYYSTKHKRKLNKIWRTKYPELDIPKWNESFDNYDTRKKVAQEIEDYYRGEARKQKGVDLEVTYEEYADMYVQALKDGGYLEGEKINEGEGDDHHYLKVSRRDYKKAMSILNGATDGNFVKMDFVDNDGAGNVIIYFMFSDGYIASGQADAFMYDAVMDLQSQDVEVVDHSGELDETIKEGTELYDRNGIQIKRFAGGSRGLMVQITYGREYIQIPADEFPILARAMQSVIGDLRDMTLQVPRSKNVDEALDSDLPKNKYSVSQLQKVHGMIVDKMKELNDIRKEKGGDHMYQGGSEPGKHSVMDHLKSFTRKKKQVEDALDKAVANVGRSQQLANEAEFSKPETKQIKKIVKQLKKSVKGHGAQANYLGKLIKEFTDNRFKGADLIDDVSGRSPDMFNKQLFADLLPKGMASENDAIEALKAHDKSPIKARMGQYAPMFVHVQYHNLEHEGEDYQMHQTQYYNSNFDEKDPTFNPGVSKITLLKDPEGEDERLGTILVKTDQYVQDLRNIPGLGKRHMEEGSGGQIMPGDYVKNQHGNIYQRVDGKVGRHDAYVRVINGKAGKRKTGLHDSFKLTLVNKDELNEFDDKSIKAYGNAVKKAYGVKVGDILTKDGKKGKVVKVMDDMANVDFGNGDVYGITFGRIKGKEITKEEAIKEPIKLEDALERYSFGEILDTAAEFYTQNGEKDIALLAKQAASKFRKVLDDFDGGRLSEANTSEEFDEYKELISKKLPSNLDEYVVDGVFHDIISTAKNLQDKQHKDFDDYTIRLDGSPDVLRAIYVALDEYIIKQYKEKGQDEELAIALEIFKIIKPNFVTEKAPGYKHDCAAKVVHETYGVGICIPEKHTLIKEGSKYVVTHYDVLFKEGKKVVKDIPVEELQIVTQKEHWHKGYKKKKK